MSARAIFVDMRDDLLASELALDMLFVTDFGISTVVRALMDDIHMIGGLGQVRVTQDYIDIRVSADVLAPPRRGDNIHWGTVIYRIAETPVKDRHGLYWLLSGTRVEDSVTCE